MITNREKGEEEPHVPFDAPERDDGAEWYHDKEDKPDDDRYDDVDDQ